MFLIPNVVQGRYFEGKIFNRFGPPNYVHVRESEFRNQGNFCLWYQNPGIFLWNLDSWVLESKTRLKESGIPLTIRIQNPSSTDKASEIRKPQLGVQCPRHHWIIFYYIHTEKYSPKSYIVNFRRQISSSQSEGRTMVFTREKNDTSNQNRERCFFTCEKNDTSNQKP